jgi:hypothetical protein
VAGVVYAHSPDHAELIQMQKHLKFAAIAWTGKTRGEKLWAALHVDEAARPLQARSTG